MKQKIIITAGILIAAIITTIAVIVPINGIRPENIIMLAVFALIVIMVGLIKMHYGTRRRQILLIIGIIQIFSGITMAISSFPADSNPNILLFVTMLIIMGVILVTRSLSVNQTSDDYRIQDERSLRIGTYGLSYSWYLTFLTVAAIGWLTGTEMTTINGAQICLILIVLMPVSARFFQWYFNNRGDVY